MGKYAMTRYKDVDVYAREIEEVYDVDIAFEFIPIVRATGPSHAIVLKVYDKDDSEPETGPLFYVQMECPLKPEYKRQQAIIRALTEVTRQCLERYCTLGQTGA